MLAGRASRRAPTLPPGSGTCNRNPNRTGMTAGIRRLPVRPTAGGRRESGPRSRASAKEFVPLVEQLVHELQRGERRPACLRGIPCAAPCGDDLLVEVGDPVCGLRHGDNSREVSRRSQAFARDISRRARTSPDTISSPSACRRRPIVAAKFSCLVPYRGVTAGAFTAACRGSRASIPWHGHMRPPGNTRARGQLIEGARGRRGRTRRRTRRPVRGGSQESCQSSVQPPAGGGRQAEERSGENHFAVHVFTCRRLGACLTCSARNVRRPPVRGSVTSNDPSVSRQAMTVDVNEHRPGRLHRTGSPTQIGRRLTAASSA